ncbi:molybdate ABC transporter substrate-binding protein [Azohydromonas lata]|uniref:Molybdate ABC transporter substrate-binding protein n=1 Tax=Azohydromonas lata TaxID=45677 RepID=A0ABU5IQ87_9BURK|nr:molybdate ABC transporter substrate-binding protein [Azohydromonas lata]MDZ5461040.1 molybdate ABC transporter substrate-binding protein [Azohydromonas lata]
MSISSGAPSGHTPLQEVARTALLAGLSTIVAGGAAAQSAAAAPEAVPAGVTVYAAGSLRTALTEAAQAFERQSGTRVAFNFGPSGLLKDKLLAGERADVFASANMEHPQALAAAGRSGAARPFARNALCLLGAPSFSLNGQDVAQRLLDPALRVGTSTPGADPAGDYAWRFFDKVESSGAAGPGSAQRLKDRALQLAGGPASPTPPPGRSVYAWLLDEKQADVFITYCTNATLAVRESRALQVLPLPQKLEVAATYGLAVLQGATPAAEAFTRFLLGEGGQSVLRSWGFGPP